MIVSRKAEDPRETSSEKFDGVGFGGEGPGVGSHSASARAMGCQASSRWPARDDDGELTKLLELINRHAELSQDLVEQGWANFIAAVNGDSHRAAVRVTPAFMAAGLTRFFETQLSCHSPKIAGGSARHSRFQCCPREGSGPAPRTPQRSFRKRASTLKEPLPWRA